MSSHWEGCSELGMILDGKEFEFFRKKYIEVHPDISEEDFDDMLYDRDSFYSEDKKKIDILYLEDSFAEGVTLLTISGQGWIYKDIPAIIILADKGNSAYALIEKGFYKTKEELIKEMKRKVSGYLPSDFDYESHIGDITYACFA